MSKLIDLLEKQRDMELEHVERLQPSVEKAGHRLVSALLETILHDSRKHAALCQALIDLEAGAAPSPSRWIWGPQWGSTRTFGPTSKLRRG
jgi:hypothetical protein